MDLGMGETKLESLLLPEKFYILKAHPHKALYSQISTVS